MFDCHLYTVSLHWYSIDTPKKPGRLRAWFLLISRVGILFIPWQRVKPATCKVWLLQFTNWLGLLNSSFSSAFNSWKFTNQTIRFKKFTLEPDRLIRKFVQVPTAATFAAITFTNRLSSISKSSSNLILRNLQQSTSTSLWVCFFIFKIWFWIFVFGGKSATIMENDANDTNRRRSGPHLDVNMKHIILKEFACGAVRREMEGRKIWGLETGVAKHYEIPQQKLSEYCEHQECRDSK